jgi:plastocyanin
MKRFLASKLTAPVAIVALGAAVLVPAAQAGRTPTVDVGSNFFAPGKVTVKKNSKVRFNWEPSGFELHDVNVRSGPKKFHSPTQAGGSYTTPKLRKPGTYKLYCKQHDDMTMKLVVKR